MTSLLEKIEKEIEELGPLGTVMQVKWIFNKHKCQFKGVEDYCSKRITFENGKGKCLHQVEDKWCN